MNLIDQIKQLREETGLSVSEIKNALEKTKGDINKAREILKTLGKSVSEKKSLRETKAGLIDSYLHPNGKVGVLLDIRCETDFVAKSSDFRQLAHEVCLQIAAMKPLFISENDIPEDFLDKEKNLYREQFVNSGKPQKIIDQIIEGKLNKYKKDVCLLLQSWIKDDSKIVKDLVESTIAKIGEKVEIKKFTRYEIN